jgi:hypothetical protein
MRGRLVSVVAVVIAATMLVSCNKQADTSRPAPSASTLGPGLQLAEPLLQDRLDATRHMLTIPIVNGGPAEVQVRRIQIIAPQFTPVPPTVVDATMEPQRRINFSIGYGTARCDDAAGEVTLLLDVGPPGGAGHQERLVAPGPVDIVDRLRRAECEQRQLESTFTVVWGGAWTQVKTGPGAARLHGELRIALTGDEQVTVTDIRGSVLFSLDSRPADRRPIVSVDPANRSATIPIEIGVRLCFKHGLTEAKKIFDFSLYAKLGDRAPTYRTITPPLPVQKRTLALLATCPPTE